jgi:hypothetical protein
MTPKLVEVMEAVVGPFYCKVGGQWYAKAVCDISSSHCNPCCSIAKKGRLSMRVKKTSVVCRGWRYRCGVAISPMLTPFKDTRQQHGVDCICSG